MNAHYQQAQRNATSMGAIIIGFAQEKESQMLYQVIAFFPENTFEQFVVWGYNAEFDGFFNGTYTANKEYAYSEFATRITK